MPVMVAALAAVLLLVVQVHADAASLSRAARHQPLPLRERAGSARQTAAFGESTTTKFSTTALDSGVVATNVPGPDLGVECAMRSVAYDMSQRHPAAKRHADMIHTSLQMDKCSSVAPIAAAEPPPCADGRHWSMSGRAAQPPESKTFWVDCGTGDDRNPGTKEAPFRSVGRSHAASRAAGEGTQVFFRAGTCYLNDTLLLTEADSGIAWSSWNGEAVTLSAGAPLVGLKWSSYKGKIVVADLPDGVNASAIDSLFSVAEGGPTATDSQRHVRARYPNGNSEVDRMPSNYDKLGGGAGSTRSWVAAENRSERFPDIVRNSSFYPWFGHSNDLRWVLDYHTENASSYYSPARSFWQAGIGTAAKYNTTTFSPRVAEWTNVPDVVLHVIHYDWWGNWQWKLDTIDLETQTMKFGFGGFQDAHGGPVASNYFFAENILEELDAPSEWYVDRHARKIYFWPTSPELLEAGSSTLVVSQLQTVVRMAGSTTNAPTTGITLSGFTFAHTTTMFVAEKYSVPSAGDWSVLSRGTVELDGVQAVEILGCSWAQIGGNGVSLSGSVHDTVIADGDFLKVGDSGIVSVGRLPPEAPFDGSHAKAEFPMNVTIERCHFGQTGVFGKQTSALFIAVSKRIIFRDNVLYDGPRAGININDGFGGGHVVQRNVIFNQLLESGDHGPINTWSRTAYIQPPSSDSPTTAHNDAGKKTLIQEWTNIDNNFVMVGPKFGALYGPGNGTCSNGMWQRDCPKGGGSMFTCLDHDDGSDYYLDTRNVCVFAGMKNYIGQNKVWDSNLIAYPDGALSQNRSGMGCVWTSMNMGGNHSLLPCAFGRQVDWALDQYCHNQETYTNNTCVTHTHPAFEYDMFRKDDLAEFGPRNTTMPFTARNKFYSSAKFQFQGLWSHEEAVAHGVDVGGEVHAEMSKEQLEAAARRLLGL